MMPGQMSLLTKRLLEFRDARDWKQFHGLKNLIVALNLEAAELLELTQWKTDSECEDLIERDAARKQLESECADVLSYLLLIADRCQIDLAAAVEEKIALNEQRYSIEKFRGSAQKYDKIG